MTEQVIVGADMDVRQWSQERWRGFNAGYKQAIKDAVAMLMIQHEAAKGSHNYWHVAAQLVQKEESYD